MGKAGAPRKLGAQDEASLHAVSPLQAPSGRADEFDESREPETLKADRSWCTARDSDMAVEGRHAVADELTR
jgi:hypothetical protein